MIKRLMDIILSIFGLIVAAPLFIVLAVLIKRDSPGPVFYRQIRVGKNGKLFKIFKFRTMVQNADKIGGPSTSGDDMRVTNIGKIIRKYNFDELAQLISVLRGEMSLVGPRPEVPIYVNLFTEEEKQILSVLPGITDWACIWNPDEGSLLAGSIDPEKVYLEKIRPEKIRLQLKYVRKHNIWVDIQILFLTLKVHFFAPIFGIKQLPDNMA
ncbi:MAG: sugar transferase [Candidatus Margulisiibacteriota bacterium]